MSKTIVFIHGMFQNPKEKPILIGHSVGGI
jgi:hypothetical protein